MSTVTEARVTADPRHLRQEVTAVPAAPARAECGFTAYARDLAQALCEVLDGTSWQAATRSPYWPNRAIDQRDDVTVIIDRRHLVTITHRTPGGTDRDLWTITVGARRIAHRTFAREAPHAVEVITRSVWRHRHGIELDPCDTLGCRGVPTVATWAGRSLCARCAERYALTGQ